ncbi:MAG: hypothetical protein DMG70_05125 [Acidobacteria bacterium]|nr:MAG: hypothetical protein DMG70_05125 [Acidobacteriota bacterium]
MRRLGFLFSLGLVPPGCALLEANRAQDGQAASYSGGRRLGRQFWIVAEHGTKAGYVRNIDRHPRVAAEAARGVSHRADTLARRIRR